MTKTRIKTLGCLEPAVVTRTSSNSTKRCVARFNPNTIYRVSVRRIRQPVVYERTAHSTNIQDNAANLTTNWTNRNRCTSRSRLSHPARKRFNINILWPSRHTPAREARQASPLQYPRWPSLLLTVTSKNQQLARIWRGKKQSSKHHR